MRKGAMAPVNEMLQWIGLLLVCIIMFYVTITWASGGAHVQRGIEQGSLMYTVANSVNALSSMEEGVVTRQLINFFDITIDCSAGACYVSTAPYVSGKLQDSSSKVLILGNIKPVSLKNVNKITLTSEAGKDISLTGEHVGDTFMASLSIPDYSVMCVTNHPGIASYISDPDINQGQDPELIAAIIQAESDWDQKSYRYEPGYQVKYIEGVSKWTEKPCWLRSGQTINQWFAQHDSRSSEKKGLTEAQLGLVAQTKASASYGLMQILYTTAVETCEGLELKGSVINLDDPEELYTPDVNIFCGTRYLKKLLSSYPDIRDAASAYNAGSPSWTTNLKNREYTMKVLGYYNAFKKCTA